MNHFKFYLVALLVAACIQASAMADSDQLQAIYPLQFRDGHTEGSWALVLDNGIKFEVEFATSSDTKAVEALSALNPEIIRLNTSPEYNIYVVGYIEKEATKRPAGEIRKAVLRLDGWYLKAPFYVPSSVDPDGSIEVSDSLKRLHFLPAGERDNSEPTRKLRESLKINHSEQLNLFWIGVQPPFVRLLSKGDRKTN